MSSPSSTHAYPHRLRRPAALLVAAAVGLGSIGATASPSAAQAPKRKAATVSITTVQLTGDVLAVSGKVTLPAKLKNTARNRKKVRVALTVAAADGQRQTLRAATINAKKRFSASAVTTLTGSLSVSARVKVKGKASGKATTRANAVTVPTAAITLGSISASGSTVTVSGSVVLPASVANTPANRQNRIAVAVTLTDSSGKTETSDVPVDASLGFTSSKNTALVGTLSVTAALKIGGVVTGTPATRASIVQVVPASAHKLQGLFGLDPGQDDASGKIWGTYFRMGNADHTAYFLNNNSDARDKNFTLLKPGTDGGLLTTSYQEPPDPAFDAVSPLGLPTGNALANRVTQPKKFFGNGFSISTAPFDAQAKSDFHQDVASPLPEIYEKDGKLYGQTTGWTASWSGTWFNQGSPKPAGTPAGFGSTPVTGTYDSTTRRYTLHWTSQIYGGAFQGAWGEWYLEGTFTPAG